MLKIVVIVGKVLNQYIPELPLTRGEFRGVVIASFAI